MAIEPKAHATPWKWCGHSWSEESVYDANCDIVCTKSIYDEATEETQEELESRMTANMKFIAEAPQRIAELEAQVAGLGSIMVVLYNSGYLEGHSDTVDGGYVDIVDCDMDSYHMDIVKEILAETKAKESEQCKSN